MVITTMSTEPHKLSSFKTRPAIPAVFTPPPIRIGCQYRKERLNRSTNYEDMANKAKRDVVSE